MSKNVKLEVTVTELLTHKKTINVSREYADNLINSHEYSKNKIVSDWMSRDTVQNGSWEDAEVVELNNERL